MGQRGRRGGQEGAGSEENPLAAGLKEMEGREGGVAAGRGELGKPEMCVIAWGMQGAARGPCWGNWRARESLRPMVGGKKEEKGPPKLLLGVGQRELGGGGGVGWGGLEMASQTPFC